MLDVDNDDVLTGAGSARRAGFVPPWFRTDQGAAIADAVARRLAVQPHREGGQAPYIEAPMWSGRDGTGGAASMGWPLPRLDGPITVRLLADQANLSPCGYLRLVAEATGVSPTKWLAHLADDVSTGTTGR